VISPFIEVGVVEVVNWFFFGDNVSDSFRPIEAFQHCFQVTGAKNEIILQPIVTY